MVVRDCGWYIFNTLTVRLGPSWVASTDGASCTSPHWSGSWSALRSLRCNYKFALSPSFTFNRPPQLYFLRLLRYFMNIFMWICPFNDSLSFSIGVLLWVGGRKLQILICIHRNSSLSLYFINWYIWLLLLLLPHHLLIAFEANRTCRRQTTRDSLSPSMYTVTLTMSCGGYRL